MDKLDRYIILTTGSKLRLEENCPQRVLDKIDELVEGYNKIKDEIIGIHRLMNELEDRMEAISSIAIKGRCEY